MGAIVNLNGGTGAELDKVLAEGVPYKDRVANFITFSADGHQRARLVAEVRRGDGAGLQGGRAGDEGPQGARPRREEPGRLVHPGRRPAPRSDLGHGREVRQAGDDPPERLDRPLLSDRSEERALRSRALAPEGRRDQQLLQERAVQRRHREGAARDAPQASEDAVRERAPGDAVLRPGEAGDVPRHVPECRRRDLGDACRTSAARRASGASS